MAKKTKDAADVLREAIQDARKKDLRMTRYRIAKLSGVSQVTISRFISGERDMRFGNAVKLIEALNLELVKRKGARH